MDKIARSDYRWKIPTSLLAAVKQEVVVQNSGYVEIHRLVYI